MELTQEKMVALCSAFETISTEFGMSFEQVVDAFVWIPLNDEQAFKITTFYHNKFKPAKAGPIEIINYD